MQTRNVRLKLDYGVDPAPEGVAISAWRAVALDIDVGLFFKGAVDDLTGLTSLTFRALATREATTNLISKTTTIFDDALTLNTWNAGTAQHATISLTAAQMNLDLAGEGAKLGRFYCVLEADRASGGKIVLGEGTLTLLKTAETADAPPENPGPAITQDAADARYVRGRIATQDGITGLIIVDENGDDAFFLPGSALAS